MLVAEQIDARLRRNPLQFLHDVGHPGYLSHGLKRLLAAVAALALVPAAHAGGSSISLGAAEDAVRAPTLVEAEASMGLVRLAGFRAVRITSTWEPGLTAPTEHEAAVIGNVAAAAGLHGVRVYVSVYHAGSRTTPLTPEAQAEFAAYVAEIVRANPSLRDVIVGNEPNLNRFWLPQFNEDGTGASAASYLSLLAATYDAVKAAAPETIVWGGALAPRGVDKPCTGRDTISPTRFIRELGRGVPGERPHDPVHGRLRLPSRTASTRARPSTCRPTDPDHLALVDQNKLVRLLGKAFDGSAQVGSGLPILYDEYGIESIVPPEKAVQYAGDGTGDDASGRRSRAGRGLRAGDQARVLPVERRRHPALPRPDEAALGRLAVRPLLPRRHAEVLARRRPRHAWTRSRAARSASALSRSGPSSRSRPAPVRSRSGATATASTEHGCCGCRPDRSRRGRTDARPPAVGSRSSSASAWLRGGTALDHVRARDAARAGRRARQRRVPVRSPSPR